MQLFLSARHYPGHFPVTYTRTRNLKSLPILMERELLEAASDADFFRAEACTCNYRVTGQLVARMSEWVHGYLDKDDYGAHHMDIP